MSDSSIVHRTLQGNLITLVSEYKYLGIIIDNTIIFSSHINYLKQKLRQKLGFYFRNKSCFSFYARKKLVCDILTNSCLWGCSVPTWTILSSLDAVYHGALRVITDCKHLTHDCTLYSRVAWSSLAVRRKMHWYLMICKAICFFLPQYLCCLIQQKSLCTFQCIIISTYLLLELIWVLRLLNMLPLRIGIFFKWN